jgi:hypothetical protein
MMSRLHLEGEHAAKMMKGMKCGDSVCVKVHGKITSMESRQDMGELMATNPGEKMKKGKAKMHHSVSLDVTKVDEEA